MMYKRKSIMRMNQFVLVVIFVHLLVSCGSADEPLQGIDANNESIEDLTAEGSVEDVIAALQREEVTITAVPNQQEFNIFNDLFGEAVSELWDLDADGELVQVYLFKDVAAAREAASNINRSGDTFTRTDEDGNSVVINADYITGFPPRFWRQGASIIYYFGQNSNTLKLLDAAFGQRIADGSLPGQPYEPGQGMAGLTLAGITLLFDPYLAATVELEPFPTEENPTQLRLVMKNLNLHESTFTPMIVVSRELLPLEAFVPSISVVQERQEMPFQSGTGQSWLMQADNGELIYAATGQSDDGQFHVVLLYPVRPSGYVYDPELRLLDDLFASIQFDPTLDMQLTAFLPTPTTAAVTEELPFPEDNPTSEVATATPFPTAIPIAYPDYECPIIDEPTPAPTASIDEINVAYVASDGIYYWQEAMGQSELLFASEAITGLQISDDGQRIAFIQTDDADTGGMSLWVMDNDGKNGRLLLDDTDFRALHGEGETVVIRPLQITWVPNSHILAFSTVRYGIVDGYVEGITAHIYDDLNLIDADSGDLTTLLPPLLGGNFTYSPDGAQIAIVNDSSLNLVNSDGSNYRSALVTWQPLGITHEYHRPQPAWLPDSRSLLIAPSNAKDNIDALYNPNASSTIWQVWINSKPPLQLSTMIGAPLWLGYSPDRRYVSFVRRIDDDLTHELHIAKVDNSVHIIYATAEGMMGGGDWLPDGSGFVFGGHNIELQIGRLCQPPIPFLLPETPESFVRRREWVDDSRFLLAIDQPRQLLLSDLNGNVMPIGLLRNEYFFGVGSLTAFDFSQ